MRRRVEREAPSSMQRSCRTMSPPIHTPLSMTVSTEAEETRCDGRRQVEEDVATLDIAAIETGSARMAHRQPEPAIRRPAGSAHRYT